MDAGWFSRDDEVVKYGTTVDDKLYYDILSAWRNLEDAYPTIAPVIQQ